LLKVGEGVDSVFSFLFVNQTLKFLFEGNWLDSSLFSSRDGDQEYHNQQMEYNFSNCV